MIWRIQDIKISQSLPQQFINSISGPTYQPQNQETTADITIVFRDFEGSVGSLEDFENQMKSSNLIYEGEEFTRKEIEKALQEIYPERFI